MTEAEWLTCEDPITMLAFLRGRGSERKFRLFGCACCRRIWDLLPSDLNRQAVRAIEEHPESVSGEQYPEGVFSHPVLSEAIRASSRVEGEHVRSPAYWAVKDLGRSYYKMTPRESSFHVAHRAASSAIAVRPRQAEAAAQAALLRCIFGNPFARMKVKRAWITPTVRSLARAAYDDRALPSGELDRPTLAVLADALLDAGCTDTELLNHCRGLGRCPVCLGTGKKTVKLFTSPRHGRQPLSEDRVPCLTCEGRGHRPGAGDHVLGCRVVDLLLGKK
jgi:hypothetical protein